MSLLEGEVEERLPLRLPDSISVAVRGSHYVENHRTDLHVTQPGGGISPRLRVSRYYWDLEPPVAVDFAQDLRYGEDEAVAKKKFFADQDVRYIVVKDDFDGEGAEAALAAATPKSQAPTPKGTRPVTGPRR